MLVLFKPVEQNLVKKIGSKTCTKNELGTTIQYICGYMYNLFLLTLICHTVFTSSYNFLHYSS